MLIYAIIFFLLINCIEGLMPTPTNYVSYKAIRKVFFDLYQVPDCNKLEYSLEHIIPQSTFKNESILKKDMHNIMLYPCKVNLHRSNYKYISDFKLYPNSKLLSNIGNEIDYKTQISNKDINIKTNKLKTFYPSSKYHGHIARSSMYFLSVYPSYQEIILNNIIDPYTILFWHYENPITKFELEKNDLIYKLQGNNNIFISEPKLLVFEMEKILGEKLDIYKNFRFPEKN